MSGVLHKQTGATAAQRTIPGSVLLLENPAWFPEEFRKGVAAASREFASVATVAAALEHVASHGADVVLAPEELDGASVAELLEMLPAAGHDCAVVVVVAEDGLERGAAALAHGAIDFLVRPFGLDQVVATLALVARSRDLQSENERLHRQLHGLQSGAAFVGCSPAARRLGGVLARVAESSATVLIEGREGSGKTLAAEIIHASSRMSDKPLRTEYCEELTLERLEPLLQEGSGCVLLLENVEKLPTNAQARIVKYIKERSSRPASDTDVRIIATTSAHLPELVARGKFREDLYYRLNVFPVVMPSLQERRDDIAVLASHFLEQAGLVAKTKTAGFTTSAMILLETHPWPGNVAQLQDVVTRAHALAKTEPVDRQHLMGPTMGLDIDLPPAVTATRQPVSEEEDDEVREEDILPLESEEKRLLARALKATKGNVRRAAQLLKIGRATLYRKIQIYQLKLN